MKKLITAETRHIDIVDYLSALGFHPSKIRNKDYWYLSPLKNEKKTSFKVNRNLNIWYDNGIGKGGTLIDFGIIYFNCTFRDFLQHISAYQNPGVFLFHQPLSSSHLQPSFSVPEGEKKEPMPKSKIVIVSAKSLTEISLLRYLQSRCISAEIANRFCKEINFLLYNKKRTAIGFQNNAGGYELRSANFKGSSSPKDVTFINQNAQELNVFEGFFNFLSYHEINKNSTDILTNFLVVNSLSFFQKQSEKMEAFQYVHLFLDRDASGIRATQEVFQWSKKYIDQSHSYKNHKDLNEYLIEQHKRQHNQSYVRGRRF